MRPKFAEFLVDAHVQKILKRRSIVLDHSLVKVDVALGGEFKKGSKSERPFVFKSNHREIENICWLIFNTGSVGGPAHLWRTCSSFISSPTTFSRVQFTQYYLKI